MAARGCGGRGRELLVAALAAVVFLAACGGGEPTRNDASTVKAMLSSSAAVQAAFAGLYGCLPDRPDCYTRHGPGAVTVVKTERDRFADALDETDNECLRDVGELYLASLDSYGEAAQAAADANPDAFDEALSQTTDKEIAFNRRLTECGFSQGRTAEINAALRDVSVEILQLGEEIGDCLRPRCIRRIAREMEASSEEGVALLEDYRDELSGAPRCLRSAVDTFLSAFRTLASSSRAIQENDFRTAEREGTRAAELSIQAQNEMASCLGSLGA
jgi:hypothetical protein